MGSSPSLSHCHFLFPSLFLLLSHWMWLGLRSDWQVWSMSNIWACASRFAPATPPLPNQKAFPMRMVLAYFREGEGGYSREISTQVYTETSCSVICSLCWNIMWGLVTPETLANELALSKWPLPCVISNFHFQLWESCMTGFDLIHENWLWDLNLVKTVIIFLNIYTREHEQLHSQATAQTW